MENTNTQLAGSPAQLSGSKVGMIVVSVSLLIVGLVVGYIIGKNSESYVVSSPIPSASKTDILNWKTYILNWKTYTDDENGFSVQYPQDWKFDQIQKIPDLFEFVSSDAGGQNRFEIMVEQVPSADQLGCDVDGGQKEQKSPDIAGLKSVRCVYEDYGEMNWTTHMARKISDEDVHVYTFFCKNVEYNPDCDYILASFKFTR